MVTRPQWRFTPSMIADAPDHAGVYVLWRHGKPLAVGHALGAHDTLRSRLLAHASHAEGKLITHYSWEITRDPLRREREVAEALDLAGARPSTPPATPRRRDAEPNEPAQQE